MKKETEEEMFEVIRDEEGKLKELKPYKKCEACD